MTVPAAVPTVREILVETIVWWVKGWLHSGPGSALQTFTPEQRNAMYDQVAAAEREVGQTRLEWIMEHLAHHGAGYMTADGQIIEANRPDGAPDLPMSLVGAARVLYASVTQGD